jgi:hypothetical protein
LACRECEKELALPEGTVVVSPQGVVARIGKAGRVDPNSVVRKAAFQNDLGAAFQALAELPPEDLGNGQYRKLVLA